MTVVERTFKCLVCDECGRELEDPDSDSTVAYTDEADLTEAAEAWDWVFVEEGKHLCDHCACALPDDAVVTSVQHKSPGEGES